MRSFLSSAVLAVALGAASLTSASAQLVITEVAPWGSGTSQYAADWFELTNVGSTAVSLTNFRVDDNSGSFALAVAVAGITSIAPGESVIFLESTTPPTTIANFLATWFGANVPAGLQVGTYSGTGVGLGTGGDAVNLFDGSGALQASVSFGASTTGLSFVNSGLINGGTLTTLSALGVNGAAAAVGDSTQIGSPGRVIPEPTTTALLVAVGAAGFLRWQRRRRA
ncbi:MAG: lamin tail domain-containing protein [Verrucomicrobia bacterium]|nr:lamin tail domain-containing protein [Verrucomicrobiota bacterium]